MAAGELRIADPIHGTVILTPLEAQIVGSRAFQRLRNVKQLGLAHLVYPGADYSRFPHSIGACHVAGRVLHAIRDSGGEVSEGDIALYRVAALLHDIGHFPFSHTTEHALKNFYSEKLLKKPGEADPAAAGEGEYASHEVAGKQVITEDPELRKILEDGGVDPKAIARVIGREDPESKFKNLVSSDLDADRLDYLCRTAHHTGVPYSVVDLNYVVSQMRLDKNGLICLTDKALRAADHLLLCRYFDYRQVSYHKTVKAFEFLLESLIRRLAQVGRLQCDAKAVRELVASRGWYTFDDGNVMESIRAFRESADADDVDKAMADALARRHAPKLIVEHEEFKPRGNKELTLQHKQVVTKIDEWAAEFKVDPRRWFVWKNKITPTKFASHVAAADVEAAVDADELAQSVRVQQRGKAIPLQSVKYSLMHPLADHELTLLRVYVLLDENELEKRDAIAARIRGATDVSWK